MTTDIRFGERELQAAAKLVAESMLEGLPDAAACGHDFSEGFRRKMEALLRRQRRRSIRHTVWHYAAAVLLTVTLTFGAVMYRALKAADELKEKYGMEAEIIDARTLVPFDYETVIESVKKTGRLVIVTDACERGSFASEVARQITEMAFDELDAPPVVVASRNWITPAHELEESFFPQPSWILDAIDAKIVPLPGHVRVTDQSLEKKLSNERRGV